jgi:cell division septation protein DedD
MKKSVAVVLFAFAMLPFSACSSSGDQAAYMTSSTAEQNAREAEQAEEEFAQLASKTATPKAKAKTKTAEHKAVVEKREPASAHETKHKASASSERVYTVQLGAFRVKENAEKLTAKLKGEGFPVMMIGKEGSKSGELYLVHLEPTPNKTEAEKWQTDLKLKSFDSTLTSKRD